MEILIDKSKTISSIQKEFQKRFPFLKIEFYRTQHSEGEGSHVENTLSPELTIGEAQKKKAGGALTIHGLMTVAELESAFAEAFGLAVQVFRKSGTVWLQTTVTDNWTLAEQNQKAMEKHDAVSEKIDPMDRQELE